MAGKLRALHAAGAALLLGGCFGGGGPPPPPASTIIAQDNSVLQPVLRASLSISNPSGDPSDPHGGHAVEAGFTRGSGNASQTIGSNYIAFGGQRFDAPASLDYDFKMSYLDIAYRFRLLGDFASLGLEVLAGFAEASLDFTASSAGRVVKESLSSGGVQLGLGGIWRPRSGTSLHARAVWFSSGDDNGVTNGSRFDVYLMQAIWKHVTLRAGYAWWSLESERGETISPIKVEMRGPALGLEVMF